MRPPGRWLIITQYYAPEIGAPQIRLRSVVKELSRLGADVTVLTGMPNYPAFSVDPHFDSIREQPDFKALMTRLKPGWEALRAEFGEPTS